MARRGQDQRTLLLPHEEPGTAFAQSFKATYNLARSLSRDKKSSGTGQVAYLQKKAQQLSYVEEARAAPKPPLESVVAQQGLISELRRDAADHLPRIDSQKPALRQIRLTKQAAFLSSREERHNNALDRYEKDMDMLALECSQRSEEAAQRMKDRVKNACDEVDTLLDPLEKTTDQLGAKTEDEVRSVLKSIESVTARRKKEISNFQSELLGIDQDRKDRSVLLLKTLADALSACAHNVPGEIERILEVKTLDLDGVLLENQKSIKVLTTKLSVQMLEDSKKNKNRWHEGLLLWKQKRHRHTVELFIQRIRSPEFEQPPPVEEILGVIKSEQQSVYDGRVGLIKACFETPMKVLVPMKVRTWEEQNTTLNDKTGDTFDSLFGDFKDFVDNLDILAETILKNLVEELKIHDARAEWGDHESVEDLVDADIRPLIKERLDDLRELLRVVTTNVSKQEETHHTVMTQMLTYFMNLAKKGESFRKRLEEFEVNYKGEEDDCIADFKEELERKEGQMRQYKAEIEDAVHQEDLDGLKQQVFEHLNVMEKRYRDHAAQLLEIHNRYPGHTANFMRMQTSVFCEELGLVVPRIVPEVDPNEEDPAAAAAKREEDLAAAAAAIEGLEAWTEGTREDCEVLEKLHLAALRDKVIAPPPPEKDVAEAAAAEAGTASGSSAEPTPRVPEPQEVAKLRDGTEVLAVLDFDLDWLEESFGSLRTNVFDQLNVDRTHLGRIDTPGIMEEVRRQLDQRLRRHTNRKGEVQVDWYVPRSSTVAKHKDKFERHLVELAKKSQGHDATVEELCAKMEEEEKRYQDAVEALKTKLSEAETLPVLSASERCANELAAAFFEAGRNIIAAINNLATRLPQELIKSNKDFLKMCRSGQEQYSKSEVIFYTSEVEDVNAQIERKAKEREARARSFEEELEEKRQTPLQAFAEQYAEAVEDLSASKGYGKKYGKPRRKAQGQCRGLIANVVAVRQNLSEVVEYIEALSTQPVGVVLPFERLPRSPKFRLRDFFDGAGEPWVFSSELLGVVYIAVCTVCVVGTHLKAFKEDRAARYQLPSLPAIRLLKEEEVLCPQDADDAAKATRETESKLREGCLEKVLGEVSKADVWENVIKSIVDEAQKSSQETFKGTVPDFMAKFLEDMKETARVARLEAARNLREWADKLRDETLPQFPEVLFGELTARAIAQLKAGTRETQAMTVAAWAELDEKRSAHETRLHPGLSNPNAEEELLELIQAEEERSQAAQAMAKEDCERMASCLRSQAESFVSRLSSFFEASTRVVDSLPLHKHFAALPGDEQEETPRISIKRRMRHIQNGTSVDQWGDGLPERQWPGVERHAFRSKLSAAPWPEDELLGEAAEEKLKELTPTVNSFRSPLHKRLFEKRNFYYEHFMGEFSAEVQRREKQLAGRCDHERTDLKTWQSSVRQLRGEETRVGAGGPAGE